MLKENEIIESSLFRKWLLEIIFVIFMVFSCDAPHNNPLDPQNPDYSYRKISGTVHTVSLPVLPIAQSHVSWAVSGEQIQTGLQGKFELLLYQPKNGWLQFSHLDFFSDSVYIDWGGVTEKKIDAYLNALPHLDSLAIYSIVLNRSPSLQKEQLIVEAFISDRDNDIDSVLVYFFNKTMGFHLPYNTTDKSYQAEFSILDLGVLSMEDFVGQSVKIEVKDILSHSLIIGNSQLVRVIHDQVILISPTANEITGSMPTLKWQQFKPGFDFYYDVEVYTNELEPQLIWSSGQISMELTEITVDNQLASGGYFWVAWAIDTFADRTRSKLSAFTVQ